MPDTGSPSEPALPPERAAYYQEISGYHLAPLWEVMKKLVPREPRPSSVPALWRYAEVLPLLMRAGSLITAREAERRVLVLENPALRGQSRLTPTLYGGLQLILPGEVAPAHRHTAAAIRFVLQGGGAYTAVDGEPAEMQRGDFVITPSWTFHDHGNRSAEPMVWLDVLDVPMVNFFETGFQEQHDAESQPTARANGHSYARYGTGVLPVLPPAVTRHSPIINYPYRQIRPVLERMAAAGEADPWHGARVRYANPLTGGWATPTMGAGLAMLPAGFDGRPYRSTDATILACVEGAGETVIDNGPTLAWTAGDVLTVPSWTRHRHRAGAADAVLFLISDRPAQEALGLWRDDRG